MDSATLLDQNSRVLPEAPLPIPVHKPVLVALFLLLSHDFLHVTDNILDYRCSLMTSPPTAYSAAYSAASICFEYSSQCEPLCHTSDDCALR